MEYKIKHLEFIQDVINRMAANSFMIKGWSITLVAGIFALSAKDASQDYIFITFIPIAIFWILDGYYLSQERLFVDLYNNIRKKKKDNTTDFSMDKSKFKKFRNSWFCSIFSKTLIFFYIALIGAVTTIYLLIK